MMRSVLTAIGSTICLVGILGELSRPTKVEAASSRAEEAAPGVPATPPPPAALQPVAKAAPSVSSSQTPSPSQAPLASQNGSPVVDESALRYYARMGDTKRLEAEIARLKALYPDWTPPADPLAPVPQVDAKVDAIWKLFAEGRIAEARKAIAERQESEPGWQPPADLLKRLGEAETRRQLINASDGKQFDAVIRLGSETPALLTCSDPDVLWRIAEAFARTDRPARSADAYRYILQNCGDGPQRLATVQKALPLLPRSDFDTLLALEKRDASGKGEFEPVRDDLARAAVGAAGEKPDVIVSDADLARVKALAESDKKASDALLLGWYAVRRNDFAEAQNWFGRARDAEDSAQASQGLALALIALKKPSDAEDVLYKWRGTSDETRAVYLAAVANTLAVSPPVLLDETRLARFAAEVGAARNVAAAQQFGWYADALNQFPTAAQWFGAALGWNANDEPSAYGLTLMRWKLGDRAGVAAMKGVWSSRSERIASVGRPNRSAVEGGETQRVQSAAAGSQGEAAPQRSAAASAGQGGDGSIDRLETAALGNKRVERSAAPARASSQAPRGCRSTVDPDTLSPADALNRGWCLMNLKRPMEAAEAFEVGLRAQSSATRRDAAYGQSLAYLQAGLVDKAAVSAVKSRQTSGRNTELRVDILSSRATSAFEAKRYHEAILALDQRARLVPEPTDLMIMRGYAYLGLRRLVDAEATFGALADTGSSEAFKGMLLVRKERQR